MSLVLYPSVSVDDDSEEEEFELIEEVVSSWLLEYDSKSEEFVDDVSIKELESLSESES